MHDPTARGRSTAGPGLAAWWQERHAELQAREFRAGMRRLEDRDRADMLCVVAYLALRAWTQGQPEAFESVRRLHGPAAWLGMIIRGAWLHAVGPA